jgi:hypothetical protein
MIWNTEIQNVKQILWTVASVLLIAAILSRMASESSVEHIIQISVDGLRSDAVTTLGRELAPNFYRLRDEGSFTDNARTDPKFANTLPNHASQLTGRCVTGETGHGWTINNDPGAPFTLHLFKALQSSFADQPYIASVFDVVHDHGLSTALYANKKKFTIFDRSWNGINGAEDRVGSDKGRDKIDTYFFDGDMATVARTFIAGMGNSNYNYALLHLRQPDSTGHASGWSITAQSDYLKAVIAVDAILGEVLALVETDAELKGTTAIILTSDHGGELGHDEHFLFPEMGFVESAIIPFYVWGPEVAKHFDLYVLNPSTRLDPGISIPTFSDQLQPIRNGDAPNLALHLLKLQPIPGSTINAAQDLAVR